MFTCFLTGIEIKEDEAYLLDIGAARIVIRELKNKAFALEKLINELSQIDKTEVKDYCTGKTILKRRRRLVCQQIAQAFSNSYPESNIFINWRKWIAKTRKNKKDNQQLPVNKNIDASILNRSALFGSGKRKHKHIGA